MEPRGAGGRTGQGSSVTARPPIRRCPCRWWSRSERAHGATPESRARSRRQRVAWRDHPRRRRPGSHRESGLFRAPPRTPRRPPCSKYGLPGDLYQAPARSACLRARREHSRNGRHGMSHAVVIAGGGPTGMMLGAELALAGIDVVIIERRPDQHPPGSRAGGLHARTLEILDQRGIADRFLAEGQIAQVAGFGGVRLDISDFPTRHPYGLGLWQKHIERILAGWVRELAVPTLYGTEVTGFA